MPRRRNERAPQENYGVGPQKPGPHLREAVAPYIALPEWDPAPALATTRLSSKNQITLPVTMLRRLGLQPGDEVDLTLIDDAIDVSKHLEGKELLDSLQGSMAHVPEWSTKEKIDKWIRTERDSWERDDPIL